MPLSVVGRHQAIRTENKYSQHLLRSTFSMNIAHNLYGAMAGHFNFGCTLQGQGWTCQGSMLDMIGGGQDIWSLLVGISLCLVFYPLSK